MLKVKPIALVLSALFVGGSIFAGGSHAATNSQPTMNIQPDPQNPTGYLVSRADLAAVEQSKASDPMYAIWSQALQTRSNTIVEAIEPSSPSNPDNVKRVERVFPQSEWHFLTQMAAPEYTYTRFLRAIGKFLGSVVNTQMAAIQMPSVRNPSSRLLLISLKRQAVTSQ